MNRVAALGWVWRRRRWPITASSALPSLLLLLRLLVLSLCLSLFVFFCFFLFLFLSLFLLFFFCYLVLIILVVFLVLYLYFSPLFTSSLISSFLLLNFHLLFLTLLPIPPLCLSSLINPFRILFNFLLFFLFYFFSLFFFLLLIHLRVWLHPIIILVFYPSSYSSSSASFSSLKQSQVLPGRPPGMPRPERPSASWLTRRHSTCTPRHERRIPPASLTLETLLRLLPILLMRNTTTNTEVAAADGSTKG